MTSGASITLLFLFAFAAGAARGEDDGTYTEFDVELPVAVRTYAGSGRPSPVTHARVTVAVPAGVDAMRVAPVLVVNATTDAGYTSSRRLMRLYAPTALAQGWIVVAADPVEDVGPDDDGIALRVALDTVALAMLERRRAGSDQAPLAFAGFSGGSKVSGWLAAVFSRQGRKVIGLFQAGINEDTLGPASKQFDLSDAQWRALPVFLLSGQRDEVATPIAHREVAAQLKRAGFRNVKVVYFPGSHEVEAGPLSDALRWFGEAASLPP